APAAAGALSRGRRAGRGGGRDRSRHRGLPHAQAPGHHARLDAEPGRRAARPHRDLPDAPRRRAPPARRWAPGRGPRPPAAQAAGIGGVTGSVRPDPEGEQPVIWQEVEALAASVLEEGPRVRALERTVSSAGRMIAAMPSRWPVRGAVNSEFGRRKSPWGEAIEPHSGLDIAANMGTPVKAPATATVVFAGPGGEYGLAVILDHGNEVKSLYGHLSKIHVKVGQRVERGFIVALSGNTGRSSGPHLHYEGHVKGQAVNPRAFLWNAPDRS